MALLAAVATVLISRQHGRAGQLSTVFSGWARAPILPGLVVGAAVAAVAVVVGAAVMRSRRPPASSAAPGSPRPAASSAAPGSPRPHESMPTPVQPGDLGLPADLQDLGSRKKCPPFKAARRQWIEEQKRGPPPVASRVAVSLDRVSGRGGAGPAQMLKAAWRDAQRDPTAAARLAEMARLGAHTADDPSLYSRAAFLAGKIMVESFCDFELGARYMASAVAGHPGSWSTRQTAGEIFHLSRALYFGFHYDQALQLLHVFNSRIYPEAWADAAGELAGLSETTAGSVTPGAGAPPCAGVVPSALAAVQPVAGDGSELPAENEKVDGYHCAMLLHAFVMAAVSRPQLLPAMQRCIQRWLPERRDELWRQYNAEVRFAVVIDRLVPFPEPRPVAAAVAAPSFDAARTTLTTVYLLGESHTLPLAWATFDLPGSGRGGCQLVPRLAVGLKAWHFSPTLTLNREREIMLRHAASIPRHSVVVVCAGEIDLREDGVVAMLPQHFGQSKLPKYASSDEALEATVAGFCAGLEQLRSSKDHRWVFVHPVRPLPRSYVGSNGAVCARLIRRWNARLKALLAPLDRVELLDFFEELCCPGVGCEACTDAGGLGMDIAAVGRATPDGERLCARFDIQDGVHLNRNYLPFVKDRLEAVLRQ